MCVRIVVLLFAFSMTLLLGSGATAQSGHRVAVQPREPAGYKDAIANALAEFEQGNFVEAREHFLKAHRLLPNARTLRGLGMTEFELRNYIDAASYLEEALSTDTRKLEGRLRTETEELLARTNGYIGHVHLQIEPRTATVRVDGFATQVAPDGLLRLVVGEHVLDFQADQRLSERRAVKVLGEQTVELEVRLAEVQQPNAPLAAPSASQEERPPSVPPTPVYKRWWLWTSVAIVAAGGVAAALLLTRRTEHREEPILTSNTPAGGPIQPARSF